MSCVSENGPIPISAAPVQGKAPSPVPHFSSFTSRNAKLRSRQPTSLMSSEASAEGHPLYMASKIDLRSKLSLSSILNHPLEKRERQTEAGAKAEDTIVRENMKWDVTDRDIFKWQNICQRGWPSVWSPISEWTRNGARSTWQDELNAMGKWHMNLDYTRRPKQRYDIQRRAITDSYLIDHDNVQGLARLIAVQLLNACFTLPPDYTSSYKPSAHHYFNTPGAGGFPDSRLISSLRMHFEVRYAPAFRHEARNMSPNYCGHEAYDGSCRSRSHTQSLDRNSTDYFNVIEGSEPRKTHGGLHASEGSAADYLLDCHEVRGERSSFLKVARSKTEPARDVQNCLSSSGNSDFCLPRRLQLRPETTPLYPNDAHRRSNHYTFPPLIHSEPHNGYIQPVKDTVVKRWRNLRCRFGQRFSRSNHDSLGTTSSSMLLASASSSSSRSETTPRSQLFSSKVKERTRHTRERSDIHSGSIESSPRYNTPSSASGSGIISPAQFELVSKYVQTPDNWIDEPSTVALERKLIISLSRASTPLSSPTLASLETPLTTPSPPIMFNSSPVLGMESSISTSPILSNRRPSQSPLPFSKSHSSRRRQRRSMLSEVSTPADIEEPGALSVASNALTSPVEWHTSSSTTVKSPSAPIQNMEAREPVHDGISFQPIRVIPSRNETQEVSRRSSIEERRPIFRMNTSGTQLFKPVGDGVEIDGFPAGLPGEAWNEILGVIKMREKSFL